MKKIIIATVILLLIVSFGHAEHNNEKLQTLTGIFHKTIKSYESYYIELDGSVGIGNIKKRVGLKGELLNNIEKDSRIAIRGIIRTYWHNGGSQDNRSPFPAAWRIYMDVKEVKIVDKNTPVEKILKEN